MSNLIQESSEPRMAEEEQEVLDPRFSMLCLNGAGGHHHPPPPPCGCRQPRSAASASATPMKRRSPTPFEDPTSSSNSKRLFLDPQFSKIDLPIPYGPQAQPQPISPLRRSLSDPAQAQAHTPSFDSSPPPPLPLRRTVSDPNPSPDKISGSPNRDSPDSKRLRRMKERLKEMNQWWNELMKEQDDDVNDTKKSGCCKEEDDEESVGVERVGDSLEIHLKCPCGKGFQILLNGTSCFYKLL